MSVVLEIDSLTKDFLKGFWRKTPTRALDALSLTVEEGEIFGFLGPNGAGKTTTLKLLMRLIQPTAGSARILGNPLSDVSVHQRIGYLPENAYFYDYLTPRELLRYFGQLSGMSNTALDETVDSTLARVGLESEAFNRQLRKFSKGMLQRVGLAQAIVHKPVLVFLDEPMSGLDPIGRRQVRDLILEMRANGTTVFFSSHILSDVEALCDRVAILNRGRLVEIGRLTEILSREASELEIVTTEIPSEAMEKLLAHGFPATRSPGGVHIRTSDESKVEEVLSIVHQAGGRLISVSQTRSSLEDFFMREVGAGQDARASQSTA